MKATRHNGRAGKNGVYNVKHNDRQFDLNNSDHIDMERAKGNVYWDVYQGFFHLAMGTERKYTFEEVEHAFYYNNYQEHVEAQNERNIKGRHPERNRTIDDVLKNKITCPEETVLQLGNIDETVSPSLLAEVAAEYFEKFNARFGSHVHILDWALHLDEATPHIHERHVFDALNKYGELCPQQEKALEELGFERPDPTKPKSKTNNCKIPFDAECRKMFLEIAASHGLDIEMVPEYGGASYLEKQDYILMNQQRRIAEKQALLDGLVMKIEDVNAVVEEAVDLAYEKACEVVTERVKEETVRHDVELVKDYGEMIQRKPKEKISDSHKSIAAKVVNAIAAKLEKASQALLGNITAALQEPKNKAKAKEQIKEQARASIREKLQALQREAREADQGQSTSTKKKGMER